VEGAHGGDDEALLLADPVRVLTQVGGDPQLVGLRILVVAQPAQRPRPDLLEQRLLDVLGHETGDVRRSVRPLVHPPTPLGEYVVHDRDRPRRVHAADHQIVQHERACGEQAVGHGTIVGMTVLIDEPIWPFRGELWCHLVSDESYEELHEVAQAMGIPRRGFQGDHYDVPARFRDRAIELGAQPVTGRELITRLLGSGLRRKKIV
jgi:Protein of unknown function (DUF4031)